MNPNDTNPFADEIKNLEAQIGAIDIKNLDPNDNGKVLSPVVETKQQPETKVEDVITPTTVVTEDPIKSELERIKGQTQGKSPKEKFEYKLQRELAQAKEMGIDIAELAGIKTQPIEDNVAEEKPLTRKDLEQILQSRPSQTKSATEMAMEIENEAERELHLHYLENAIRPSGNAEQDFQTAKVMVNGIKMQNQLKLNSMKPETISHSTASSFTPEKKETFDNQKLTREEEMFLTDARIRGVALTKEEIIMMRK
jgi:hypothetical protein